MALLHEFELHLRENEVERARDGLATITTTLALALTNAQKRSEYPVGGCLIAHFALFRKQTASYLVTVSALPILEPILAKADKRVGGAAPT
jgi:hypothetical protein